MRHFDEIEFEVLNEHQSAVENLLREQGCPAPAMRDLGNLTVTLNCSRDDVDVDAVLDRLIEAGIPATIEQGHQHADNENIIHHRYDENGDPVKKVYTKRDTRFEMHEVGPLLNSPSISPQEKVITLKERIADILEMVDVPGWAYQQDFSKRYRTKKLIGG